MAIGERKRRATVRDCPSTELVTYVVAHKQVRRCEEAPLNARKEKHRRQTVLFFFDQNHNGFCIKATKSKTSSNRNTLADLEHTSSWSPSNGWPLSFCAPSVTSSSTAQLEPVDTTTWMDLQPLGRGFDPGRFRRDRPKRDRDTTQKNWHRLTDP